MSSLDPQLIGWWKVQSIEMPEGQPLGLIGGLEGDRVSFSKTGRYNVFPDDGGTQRFRTRIAKPHRELDIWIKDLEPLVSLCLYAIEDDVLTITVAGRPLDSDPEDVRRPTSMRMDKRRSWVVFKMKRCNAPQRRGKKQTAKGLKLKPGSPIPDRFLDQ